MKSIKALAIAVTAVVVLALFCSMLVPRSTRDRLVARSAPAPMPAVDAEDAAFAYRFRNCEEQHLRTDKCTSARFLVVTALQGCEGISSDHCDALRDLYRDVEKRDFHSYSN